MKRALLMGAAAAVLLSVGLGAQGRNFAGTWTVDTEKTMAANAGVAGGGGIARGGRGGAGGGVAVAGTTGGAVGVMTATGGGRGGGRARSGGGGGVMTAAPGMTFTIDATTFTIAQGETSTSYKTDGTATNLDNAMRKASAKAAWQGDKLVIDTTTDTPNGPVVTRATWYIEGDSLVRENKSTGADGQEIVRKTFYKKSAGN